MSIVAAAAKEDVGESWLVFPLAAPVARFLHGLIYRVNDVGCMLVPALWKASISPDHLLTLPLVFFVLLFAVVAWGWLRIVRRKMDVLVLTFPAYLVLYSHWVCDQPGGRFMLPMLPIITACLWYGIAPLVKKPTIVFGLLVVAHLRNRRPIGSASMPARVSGKPELGDGRPARRCYSSQAG